MKRSAGRRQLEGRSGRAAAQVTGSGYSQSRGLVQQRVLEALHDMGERRSAARSVGVRWIQYQQEQAHKGGGRERDGPPGELNLDAAPVRRMGPGVYTGRHDASLVFVARDRDRGHT